MYFASEFRLVFQVHVLISKFRTKRGYSVSITNYKYGSLTENILLKWQIDIISLRNMCWGRWELSQYMYHYVAACYSNNNDIRRLRKATILRWDVSMYMDCSAHINTFDFFILCWLFVCAFAIFVYISLLSKTLTIKPTRVMLPYLDCSYLFVSSTSGGEQLVQQPLLWQIDCRIFKTKSNNSIVYCWIT